MARYKTSGTKFYQRSGLFYVFCFWTLILVPCPSLGTGQSRILCEMNRGPSAISKEKRERFCQCMVKIRQV
jgi:hypothetical protein